MDVFASLVLQILKLRRTKPDSNLRLWKWSHEKVPETCEFSGRRLNVSTLLIYSLSKQRKHELVVSVSSSKSSSIKHEVHLVNYGPFSVTWTIKQFMLKGGANFITQLSGLEGVHVFFFHPLTVFSSDVSLRVQRVRCSGLLGLMPRRASGYLSLA